MAQKGMNKHWMDDPSTTYRFNFNLVGHFNRPRVDAETIAKMFALKQKLLGSTKSIYEEALIAEEKNEDPFLFSNN